jgi:hypothetical protein
MAESEVVASEPKKREMEPIERSTFDVAPMSVSHEA